MADARLAERPSAVARHERRPDQLLTAAAELESADAETILAWTFEHFRRVAVVASLQAESIVLIDMASRLRHGVEVITLDTGRLPQETHDIMDVVRRRFPITLRVLTPEPRDVERMVANHGVNLFYRSPELRHRCCEVRKVRPLASALQGYDAWVTGLRREPGATRSGIPVIARDEAHGGIAKVAPLVRWRRADVEAYVRHRSLPNHALYGRGYTSIGCAPCTRATREGEAERAGRWWWERSAMKECGLHLVAPASPAGEIGGPAPPSEAGAGSRA
jgi:thioredoxin-dependent adenylylsulfate APS reductase